MKWYITGFLCMVFFANSFAQLSRDMINTDFVLYQRRVSFDKNMREQVIGATFKQPLDSISEDKYREACWAISQFLFRSEEIENGYAKLFSGYTTIETSTKRAFLEAVYGTYPVEYKKEIEQLIKTETNPKLFAMQAIYLLRMDNSIGNSNRLKQSMISKFPKYKELVLLNELDKYLQNHVTASKQPTPSLIPLFQYQKTMGQKIIYSFQRWNRDYPGLAIVQNADGSFAKDTSGRLLVFEQLARSASDLPYFITNGSTPQGIFSIQGTEVSHNNFIGPTPNIQLLMPGEADSIFWNTPYDSLQDPLTNYLNLLPESWRNYQPITESFYAGKAGRTEIIAHGTTIDPDYFKDKPFYPLTPTLGCLCAKETWNIFNGKFLQSDQFNLANTFLSTPGSTGYLFVINIDNRQKAVSREEIEKWVQLYESTK
jgi:hypothetical protein